MTTIIGVDFSGAKAENKTWIAQGVLTEDGALRLNGAHSITRAVLCELLAIIPPPAVVGMDFPFGVPKCFAEAEFGFKGTQMPEMWEVIAKIPDLPAYIQAIRPRLRPGGDLSRFNKCLRQGDKKHFKGVAFSPLNPALPEMFPMTFYGMKMLHTLWVQSDCRVPPLDDAGRKGVVLMELMPGAYLKAVGLPSIGYKGTSERARQKRAGILSGLPKAAGISLSYSDMVHQSCIDNDDCLDAVVAAVCTAAWVQYPERFCHPDDDYLPAAQQEGWIYAPPWPK